MQGSVERGSATDAGSASTAGLTALAVALISIAVGASVALVLCAARLRRQRRRSSSSSGTSKTLVSAATQEALQPHPASWLYNDATGMPLGQESSAEVQFAPAASRQDTHHGVKESSSEARSERSTAQSNSAVSAASSLQLDSLLKARLRALKRLDHSDSCSLHTGEPVCARHVCLGCDTSGKHKFSLLSTAFGDLALLAGISHCMHSHCAAWERADSSRS